jgi:hypothetical protein
MNMPFWRKLAFGTVLSIAMAASALAARVHLKGDPTFTDTGENIQAVVSLAGLGNKDVTVMLTATGNAHVTYYNPGGNVPLGQNKYPVSTVTWITVPSKQIKNGTVSVTLTTPEVELADPPNPNWTVDLDDVEFETATITVIQGGKVVLNQTIQL